MATPASLFDDVPGVAPPSGSRPIAGREEEDDIPAKAPTDAASDEGTDDGFSELLAPGPVPLESGDGLDR